MAHQTILLISFRSQYSIPSAIILSRHEGVNPDNDATRSHHKAGPSPPLPMDNEPLVLPTVGQPPKSIFAKLTSSMVMVRCLMLSRSINPRVFWYTSFFAWDMAISAYMSLGTVAGSSW